MITLDADMANLKQLKQLYDRRREQADRALEQTQVALNVATKRRRDAEVALVSTRQRKTDLKVWRDENWSSGGVRMQDHVNEQFKFLDAEIVQAENRVTEMKEAEAKAQDAVRKAAADQKKAEMRDEVAINSLKKAEIRKDDQALDRAAEEMAANAHTGGR